MPKHANDSERAGLLGAFVSILFSASLAVTLFAAGFAACTLQPTTAVLSRLASDFKTSVYTPEDTTSLAVATRDFTLGSYSDEKADLSEFAQKVLACALSSSSAESPKSALWDGVDVPQTSASGAAAAMYELAGVGAQFALGPDEISHLSDCNRLIRVAVPPLVVMAAIALITGIIVRTTYGRRAFCRCLVAGPVILVVVMCCIGIWAALDFPAFFSAFHSLLFPQGNWTFPADSLLICMLPTPFWMGMAGVWAFVTVALSALLILLGYRGLRAY